MSGQPPLYYAYIRISSSSRAGLSLVSNDRSDGHGHSHLVIFRASLFLSFSVLLLNTTLLTSPITSVFPTHQHALYYLAHVRLSSIAESRPLRITQSVAHVILIPTSTSTFLVINACRLEVYSVIAPILPAYALDHWASMFDIPTGRVALYVSQSQYAVPSGRINKPFRRNPPTRLPRGQHRRTWTRIPHQYTSRHPKDEMLT